MICKKCGEEFNIGIVCPNCGEKCDNKKEIEESKTGYRYYKPKKKIYHQMWFIIILFILGFRTIILPIFAVVLFIQRKKYKNVKVYDDDYQSKNKFIGKPKKRVVAVVLLVLFGGWGIYLHYVGRHISAFIMLLLLISPIIVGDMFNTQISEQYYSYINNNEEDDDGWDTDFNFSRLKENTSNYILFEAGYTRIIYEIVMTWLSFDLFMILSGNFTDKYNRSLE